jgi:hypothetical protein
MALPMVAGIRLRVKSSPTVSGKPRRIERHNMNWLATLRRGGGWSG